MRAELGQKGQAFARKYFRKTLIMTDFENHLLLLKESGDPDRLTNQVIEEGAVD